jgi:hypothetical protein
MVFEVFVSVLLLLCEGKKGTISSSFSKPPQLLYEFVFRFEELSNHFPREKSVMPFPMFVLLLRS